MKRELVNILRCPKDKAKVELAEPKEEKGEIAAGSLICNSCGTKYPIVNFIPVMVADENNNQGVETVTEWAFQWTNEKLNDFEDVELDLEYSEWNLPENWLNGKKLLDVGCGNGRHSKILNRFKYDTCIAFDLSESIYAMLHKKEFEGIHLIRADMAHPPLPDEYFDFVLARQVLQHSKDPGESIKALTKILKKGGFFVGSLYKTPERFFTYFKLKFIEAVRYILQLFPKRTIYYFTWFSIPCYKYKILYPIGRLFFIRSKNNTSDAYTWNLNHDEYIATYQYTFTREETVKFFKDAGLDDLVESKEWENLFRATKQ